MSNKVYNSNIVKTEAKSLEKKITIGGVDFDKLPSKAEMVRLLVEEATESAHSLAKGLLEDTQQKIAEVEKAALEEAERMKHEAYEQAYQEGYEQGFDEGFGEGYQEATEKVDEIYSAMMAEIGNILFEIEKERTDCLDAEEDRVKSFITKLAFKLIKRDLSYDPETFLELIKQSVASLEKKAEVKISLHPESAEKFEQIKDKVISSCPGLKNFSIEADASLDAGSFVLESNKERLDLRLDSQLDRVLDKILMGE